MLFLLNFVFEVEVVLYTWGYLENYSQVTGL